MFASWQRWWLWGMAMFFATWENIYFGWNAFPKSDAELIADGLSLVLLAFAILYKS